MTRPDTLVHYWRLRSRLRRGHWTKELVERTQDQFIGDPGNYTLSNFIDVLHAVQGHTPSSIHEVLEVALTLDDRLATRLRCRIAALCLEYRVPIPESLQPQQTDKYLQRYPSLLANSHHCKIPDDTDGQLRVSRTENFTILARRLCERTQNLTDELTASSGLSRLCIVGNAPTELGKKQMYTIDSADLVFRFNHAITSELHRQAYGSRTDYWTISPSYSLQESNLIAKKIAVSGISPFDKPSIYWQSLALQDDVSYFIYPKTVWYSLVDKLEAPPSAGLLCLATLMQWRSDTVQIETYGFSRGVVSSKNHYADTTRRSSRHNWVGESEMVLELTADATA